MVIPWPKLTTQPGAILSATLRDGAIFAHCCAGQDLHGMTMRRPVRLTLRKNDHRRSDQISINRPYHAGDRAPRCPGGRPEGEA